MALPAREAASRRPREPVALRERQRLDEPLSEGLDMVSSVESSFEDAQQEVSPEKSFRSDGADKPSVSVDRRIFRRVRSRSAAAAGPSRQSAEETQLPLWYRALQRHQDLAADFEDGYLSHRHDFLSGEMSSYYIDNEEVQDRPLALAPAADADIDFAVAAADAGADVPTYFSGPHCGHDLSGIPEVDADQSTASCSSTPSRSSVGMQRSPGWIAAPAPKPSRRRADPVRRGAEMRQLWSKDKFLKCSGQRKFDLRNCGPPVDMDGQFCPRRRHGPLLIPDFVPPHEKSRHDIRLQVRQQLMMRDIP
mmetsp:Transcript_50312/g.106937  ORF Transcript_50312/g.106937 Transcript_50312/m.106937 type:complete len:307 (-) Transcript_50312:590-1510(-)|eukprot:CAMPEP_0206487266 /NCGR_PEP_ID=MMETSP0324_2-20121206/41519_1 /ASSEMBLY_ACC=CAM_ASM_000836 /TAXON_ID=2866 /ORGANISM="Crypthecodinium cohnii, Strain Seligo" /LENGTH=306 /DNA_ID=CAMNT_0053965675 /DNA_START=144 /DNA_END=1064 /DNA_ORIENTATION=-